MSSTNSGHIFQVAQQDASCYGAAPVNLKDISEADARKLISEEHKALGYRPPPGSLASQAQALVARHETSHAKAQVLTLNEEQIKEAVLLDAERIKKERESTLLDLNCVGEAEAKKLMSDEHKALGYRPPPGSLAAMAQAAAAKHPDANAGVDPATLAQAALEDAKRIAAERSSNDCGSSNSSGLNLNTISAPEARTLQSEEHKLLGHRPPAGSAAAQAQSVMDQRAHAPVTKEWATSLESQEHNALGHRPESGTMASTAQSLADKNAQDGGDHTLGDVGL